MKYNIVIALAAFAILATPVAAEDVANERTGTGIRPPFKDQRMMLKEELDKKTDFLKLRTSQTKEEYKNTLEAKRLEMKAIPEEMKVQREEAKAEFKKQIEARREALKKEVANIKREKLAVRKEFVHSRLFVVTDAMINRHDRISAVLDKMKANGKDVAQAQILLAKAKVSLTTAKDALAELKAQSAALETEAAALRELAKKAEAALKEAKELLSQTLNAVDTIEGTTKAQ